ncbi:MAG: hypothetical protein ACR2PR_07465 [Pseudohongiellaceae bacterium]
MEKPIAKLWAGFEAAVVPPGAGKVQRDETRLAFYAGACSLWALMQGDQFFDQDSDGLDPTADDMASMMALQEEVDTFGAELDLRVGVTRQ